MFLEKSISAGIEVAKMIAEIISVNHPEIYVILRDCTFEDIKKVSAKDSIGGVKEYLLYRGVSSEALSRFMLAYSQSLLKMDSSMLLYDYFQLAHIQDKVRARARNNAKLRVYTGGRSLTDSEWSSVSAWLGDFLINRPFHFRPELVNIHNLYERALEFCLKGIDLYNSDFGKRGLNVEIGESTITLLHNQRSAVDFDSIRDDLTGFMSIALDIYRASKQLWRHNPQGASKEFVIYDLVSRYQENLMQNVRSELSRKLRAKTKGRTSLAPPIEFIKTHGVPGDASPHVQKILDYKVTDRDAQLKPLDDLLLGVSSSTDIYNARIKFFEMTQAVKDRDGRLLFKGFSQAEIDESMNIIIKGYIALKTLLDFCRKTGFNFLKIPTYAFRDQRIAKRYDSLRDYVNFIDISLKLERESRSNDMLALQSNEMVYGEDMLQLKHQLSTSSIGDVFMEEEFKDLTFVRQWMETGHYTQNSNWHKIFREMLNRSEMSGKIWGFLKGKYIDVENEFELKFVQGVDAIQAFKSLWMPLLKDLNSDTDKLKFFHGYFLTVPKHFLEDKEASNEACFFMYLRSTFLLEKVERIIRPFISKIVTTVDGVTRIKNEDAVFRIFHENSDVFKLLRMPNLFSELHAMIKDLSANHFYSVYTNSAKTEKSMVLFLAAYMKEYSKIFDFIKFLYRKYVVSVVESFTEVSKRGIAVEEEVLLDICYRLYQLPFNDEAGENAGYMYLRSNSTIDPDTGILMDAAGVKPISIKSDKGSVRKTYVHENGYLVEVINNKIVLERPISKGDKISAES